MCPEPHLFGKKRVLINKTSCFQISIFHFISKMSLSIARQPICFADPNDFNALPLVLQNISSISTLESFFRNSNYVPFAFMMVLSAPGLYHYCLLLNLVTFATYNELFSYFWTNRCTHIHT